MKVFVQIAKDKLEKGVFYLGRGRNGNIGLWNGDTFLVLHEEFTRGLAGFQNKQPHVKEEEYFTQDNGCFQPFVKINDGQLIPYKDERKEAGYGEYLAFHNKN